MENIAILVEYLREHGWHMTSFLFHYNNIEYIVLFEDIQNLDIQAEGYDALITFIDVDDMDRTLTVKASADSFKFKVKEFREYFHIDYGPNLGNIFQQFYEYFNGFVPTTVNLHQTEQERQMVLNRLNGRDNDNNMCCFKLMRNPIVNDIQHHRTPFNDQKCRMLRPDLYERYINDDTVSFCFRENNEIPTEEIMRNFALSEERRLRNRNQ